MGLSLSTKFIYVLHISYTFHLQMILYNIFNIFVHETKFHNIKFSTCGIVSALKKILKFWSVLDFRLGMLNLNVRFLWATQSLCSYSALPQSSTKSSHMLM
jgi:hypothetical protein